MRKPSRHNFTRISPSLLPAAAQNVLAHLIELAATRRVLGKPNADAQAIFALA
ncbi:MAG: hypothetical protein U5N55_07125 [Cypionkella sp.]|nr:hypothetical protein [Cypionkella sp.]